MVSPRVRIGELLVEASAITPEQLAQALEVQSRDGRRLGTLLVEAGFVTEVQVTQILSQQLSVPWVSLYHIDFSRQLLDLVPKDVAERYGLVPIFVRRIRGQGNTLYIAMEDPSDEAAITAVQQYSGLPVRCMIAPPSDIRGAIRAYYQANTELGPTSLPPPAVLLPNVPRLSGKPAAPDAFPDFGEGAADLVQADAPPPEPSAPVLEVASSPGGEASASREKEADPAPAALPADAIAPASENSQHVPAREESMPTPKRGQARRRVTLTLLDGTQVTLPARPLKQHGHSPKRPDDAMSLTARDIVQALRAKLHGQNATEVLGEHDRWEGLFVALLSVLLKKQLIADWEFIDELKRL